MEQQRPRILVLSSHTKPHFPAPVNHALYCERHGYDYLFDATPYRLKSPFDQKTLAIVNALGRSDHDWLFWIDDDAFFMDFDVALADIAAAHGGDFIFCRSPVSPKGQWSEINAGIYFVRNTPEAAAIMREVLDADNAAVREWWDADRFGMYTTDGSDQEKLLYVFDRRGMLGDRVKVLDHTVFNARPYHFTRTARDHFICHLASHADKYVPYRDMQRRFGLDRYLMEPGAAGDLAGFRWSVFTGSKRPPKRLAVHWWLFREGLRRRAKRALGRGDAARVG